MLWRSVKLIHWAVGGLGRVDPNGCAGTEYNISSMSVIQQVYDSSYEKWIWYGGPKRKYSELQTNYLSSGKQLDELAGQTIIPID